MRKSSISRHVFMRRLSSGALSVAVVPSLAWGQNSTSGLPLSIAGSEQGITYIPPLFDCNKYFGPGFPKKPDFPQAADLLAHIDRLSIDRSVAWHTTARDIHPMEGNEQLLRDIKAAGAQTRIIPSFITPRQ
jgi:hypothetical protein